MGTQKIDRSKLTFSQAEGIELLPQPMALGELSEEVRNLLWSYIYECLKETHISNRISGLSYVGNPWNVILDNFHVFSLRRPSDEFNNRFEAQIKILKEIILRDDYNRVFDFFQFVLRHSHVPHQFRTDIRRILENCLCAYTIMDDGPTIVPSAIPEQGESIQASLRELASGPFGGARMHLRKSAECIREGDFSGSVRESIHVVESVARRLSPDAERSLTPALDALSKNGVELHGAFKGGIEKLYGYSSDKEGIRHALVSKENADVDVEDAAFMFGACASFAAYLVGKARKAGILNE